MFWGIKTTVSVCFLSIEMHENRNHSSVNIMTRTVQLHCPINAQIGPVDNQSDSRILL